MRLNSYHNTFIRPVNNQSSCSSDNNLKISNEEKIILLKGYSNPYIVLSDTIMKENPDVNAKELMQLNCDDIVDFVSDAYEDHIINNIWYKVKFKNTVGWCLKTSIKKLS